MKRRPDHKSSWTPSTWTPDRWIAIAALVCSLIALGVTAYNSSLDRDLRRTAMRPNVSVGLNWDGTGAGWLLANPGPGPAVIRWLSVYVDEQMQATPTDVLAALGLPGDSLSYQTAFYPGQVKAADQSPNRLLWVSRAAADELRKSRNRVKVEVCYCSVYDECWKIDDVVGSQRSDSCAVRPPVIFHVQ
jgi:hypothetical protein